MLAESQYFIKWRKLENNQLQIEIGLIFKKNLGCNGEVYTELNFATEIGLPPAPNNK